MAWCSAHRLQLVGNDGYAELISHHRVQSILIKTKAISTLSRRSSHFAYSLSHKILVPCETQWNSYFHIYEHIIKHYEDIKKALQNINQTELTISRPQKEVLALIVDVMDFFSETTNILQWEETSTSNCLIPVIDSLENALIQVAINGLCERLLTSLQTRFSYLLQSKIYQTATALDPCIKLSFTDNEKESKVFLSSSNVVKQSIKSLLPPQLVEQDNHQPTTCTVTATRETTAKNNKVVRLL